MTLSSAEAEACCYQHEGTAARTCAVAPTVSREPTDGAYPDLGGQPGLHPHVLQSAHLDRARHIDVQGWLWRETG